MRNTTRLRALVGGSFAALGVFTIGAGLALAAGTTAASAAGGIDKKDYVCKYVGTSGVNERLQAGNNPIWVGTDFPEGAFFNDAHGRSFVLIADTPRLNPEPDPSACPDPTGGVTDSTEPADPETGTTDSTEPADPETGTTDSTEPADPETGTTDSTEPADPETGTTDSTEPADPETGTTDSTEPANPETDTVDPESDTVDPESDTVDPETDTVDPTGTGIVVAGDQSDLTGTAESETETESESETESETETEFEMVTSTPSESGFAEPRPVGVPTAVAAGLAGPGGSDHGRLGQLLGLLGTLMSVGGLVVSLTGRPRAAHQL